MPPAAAWAGVGGGRRGGGGCPTRLRRRARCMGRLQMAKGDSPTSDGAHEADGAVGRPAGPGSGATCDDGTSRGGAEAVPAGFELAASAGRTDAGSCATREGVATALVCPASSTPEGRGRAVPTGGAGRPVPPPEPLAWLGRGRPGGGRGGGAVEPAEEVLDHDDGLRVGDLGAGPRARAGEAGRRTGGASPWGSLVARRCTSRLARRLTRRGAGRAGVGAPDVPGHGLPHRGHRMRRCKRGSTGYSTR